MKEKKQKGKQKKYKLEIGINKNLFLKLLKRAVSQKSS